MRSHAPAQTIETEVMAGVEEIRAEGKRRTTQKLDLSDPRQINREVVVALSRRIHPDLIADKIKSLLDMTRPTKHGPAADVRAMEAGIKLYLAYVIGLPTQRQEIVQVNLDADSATGLCERLRNSPALRESLTKLIGEAEAESVSEKKV
jgi:hypothetical protein